MKYSKLTGFTKHLKSASPNNFSQTYLILAKDPAERMLALDKLFQHLQQSGLGKLAIKAFSAKESKVEDILTELETFSFFQSVKLVHISNAQLLKKASMEKLEPFFARPSKGVYLVLSASELKADAFYKKAEKHGIILEISEEKPWEKEKTLLELLEEEAFFYKKKASQAVLQALIKALGPDASLLVKEFEKLCCFVGDRPEIGLGDIQAVVEATNQETAWQLSEQLLKRNAASAFRIFRGILSQDTPFFVALRQIRNQFQTAFQIASLDPGDLRKEFPYMKETALERMRNLAASYGLAAFPRAMHVIDEVELMAKNGVDQYDFLSDLLIFRLTSTL